MVKNLIGLGLIFSVGAVAWAPTIALASERNVLCSFESKRLCVPGGDCTAKDPSEIIVEIDLATRSYYRCAKSDGTCNREDINSSAENVSQYVNIELPGRGAFAKLGPNNEFTEVVSLGSAIIVSFGRCFAKPEG